MSNLMYARCQEMVVATLSYHATDRARPLTECQTVAKGANLWMARRNV
jgi:hypothetical protein